MAAYAELKRIDDPRDNLERARKPELVKYAKANGVTAVQGVDIDHPAMAAMLIRRALREKGLTRIVVPPRPLGGTPAPAAQQNVPATDAAADMARQLQEHIAAPPPPPPPTPIAPKRLVERPRSEINSLRDECKRLGVKMERGDNLQTLKAKIAAHGQNASEQRQ